MSDAPSARSLAYWADFVASRDASRPLHLHEAFHFGDSEALADELAGLVVAGTKRATATLLWTFEAEGEPLPSPGATSIVESFAGEPLCVIETTDVRVVPFDEVDAAFAATEGEDDGSLAAWRTGHWAYFGRECARLGRTPDPSMPVVCESFDVIHCAAPGRY